MLPVLETVRRGMAHWAVDFTTMFEDYLAGGLLLVAWFARRRGKPYAPALLLTAWAYFTGLMTTSLAAQIEETIRGVDLEPDNGIVLAFKVALWVTCVVSVVSCARQGLVRTDGLNEQR